MDFNSNVIISTCFHKVWSGDVDLLECNGGTMQLIENGHHSSNLCRPLRGTKINENWSTGWAGLTAAFLFCSAKWLKRKAILELHGLDLGALPRLSQQMISSKNMLQNNFSPRIFPRVLYFSLGLLPKLPCVPRYFFSVLYYMLPCILLFDILCPMPPGLLFLGKYQPHVCEQLQGRGDETLGLRLSSHIL